MFIVPFHSRLALPGAALLALFASCSDNDNRTASPQVGLIGSSLSDVDLGALAGALSSAGLDATLNGDGPFTLLGPTDDAFSKIPTGAVGQPGSGALATLEEVLTQHVIAGDLRADDLRGTFSAAALGGELVIDEVGGQLYVNNARVTEADITAQNGVIHKLDAVLLPQRDLLTTLEGRNFSTLTAAIVAAGLTPSLTGPGSFTVLAPTDAAFALLGPAALNALLQPQSQAQLVDILAYHVIPQKLYASTAVARERVRTLQGADVRFALAGTPTVEGVTISSINIPCTNGMIHVIDAVLTPPADIGTVIDDLGLTTFMALANSANLNDDLMGLDRVTAFLPSDEAFAQLPASTTMALTDPANADILRRVLLYHVAPRALSLADVFERTTVETVRGEQIEVMGAVGMLGGAAFVSADNHAAQGFVHVIDAVLVPPGLLLP